MVDNLNKSSEAIYWKDDFLKVKACNDAYHHTHDYLNLAKNFVTTRLNEDFDMSKADQANYLNRSVDYFKKHDQFEEIEFVNNRVCFFNAPDEMEKSSSIATSCSCS